MQALDKNIFKDIVSIIFKELGKDECLSINLSGEKTHFTRLSQAKIRQTTNLDQAFMSIDFIKNQKKMNLKIPYRGINEDAILAISKINDIRKWIDAIPDDPYLVEPKNNGESVQESLESLPNELEMLLDVLVNAKDYDLAGVFSSGDLVYASTNSLGQFHWFKTRNFYLDYSLYNGNKAVKGLYAGTVWNKGELVASLKDSAQKLTLMNQEAKKVPKGEYRVYLAPSAVSEIVGTMSWGGLSMSAHQQGSGALTDLWKGKKKLSPKFTLTEDFRLGLSPKFNGIGEVSSDSLSLIERGELKSFLVSTRTALEYKLETNFADESESPRAVSIATGNLKQENILNELGTGLYISDLHYLNWSDRESARITGMTRYACFWVENGEIVAPIEDLRFDESLYNIFGDALVSITENAHLVPATGSYFQREIGGKKVPGLLLSKFTFTL